MSWFKRYLVGCLIAVVLAAGFDAYTHKDGAPYLGTILFVSAGWPVFAAVVVGSTIGDIVHDATYGKAG